MSLKCGLLILYANYMRALSTFISRRDFAFPSLAVFAANFPKEALSAPNLEAEFRVGTSVSFSFIRDTATSFPRKPCVYTSAQRAASKKGLRIEFECAK